MFFNVTQQCFVVLSLTCNYFVKLRFFFFLFEGVVNGILSSIYFLLLLRYINRSDFYTEFESCSLTKFINGNRSFVNSFI